MAPDTPMTQSDSAAQASIARPPVGLAALFLLGPSLIWCAEYIGSGEVILATRSGAILGTGILWVIISGIFLKFWIGMAGARYTVCTGEGMIDMIARVPGPARWGVWIVLVAQVAAQGLWGASTKSLWQQKHGKKHKLRSDKNFLVSQNILVLKFMNLDF